MIKKYNIGFLILHYYTISDTIKCIDTIIRNVNKSIYNCEIVIVDNNSLNNTGQELIKKYKDNDKIHILLNKQNLGFAGGNNIGFKYLKDNLKCNFIIMANNDILFKDNNISKNIVKAYEKYNCALIGPSICDVNGDLTYAGSGQLDSVKKVKKDIFKLKIGLILINLHLIKISKLIKRKTNNNDIGYNDGIIKENVLLHGSCLIFCPNYIDKFDGIDNRTFLYREEDLLYLRLQKNKMKTLYYPNINVIHIGSSSSNYVKKGYYSKMRNKYKNLFNSTEILYSEMKK